jgi:hypothetical protein
MPGHKGQTASRVLRYEFTNSASAGTEVSRYVDLARDLSGLNRRLYRSGMVYGIKKITVVSRDTPALGSFVSVSAVPNTWVVNNAWKRGKDMWEKMGEQAGLTDNVKSTWRDYKVNMTDDFRIGAKAPALDNGGNGLAIEEWDYSTYTTPDGTATFDDFAANMLGDDNGAAGSRVAVGLVKSYGSTRPFVMQSPDVNTSALTDDPLINIFDSGTHVDETLEEQIDENDNPPYGRQVYAGGASNHPKPIVMQHGTLSDGSLVLGGFDAPLGQLEFEMTSPIDSDVYSVLIEVAPGNYKGVKAHPMG